MGRVGSHAVSGCTLKQLAVSKPEVPKCLKSLYKEMAPKLLGNIVKLISLNILDASFNYQE